MEFYSKYYKGELAPPKNMNPVEAFFFGYEQQFYRHYTEQHNGLFPTKEEFEKWLNELLDCYLPDKILTGYEAPNATQDKAASFRRQYETGQQD